MATEEFWHFSKLLYEKDAEGHHDTAHCNIRTLPFTNSSTLPKYTQQPAENKKAATDYWERQIIQYHIGNLLHISILTADALL